MIEAGFFSLPIISNFVFSKLSFKFETSPKFVTISLYFERAFSEHLMRLNKSSAKPSFSRGVEPFQRVPGGFRSVKLSIFNNKSSITKINRKPDKGSPCGTPVRMSKNLLSLFRPKMIQLLRFDSHAFIIEIYSGGKLKNCRACIITEFDSIESLREVQGH